MKRHPRRTESLTTSRIQQYRNAFIRLGITRFFANDEGKINGMEGNRKICGDIIAGTFLIAGDDGCGGTTDLTDDQIDKYTKMFEADESYTPEEVEGSAGFYIVGFD